MILKHKITTKLHFLGSRKTSRMVSPGPACGARSSFHIHAAVFSWNIWYLTARLLISHGAKTCSKVARWRWGDSFARCLNNIKIWLKSERWKAVFSDQWNGVPFLSKTGWKVKGHPSCDGHQTQNLLAMRLQCSLAPTVPLEPCVYDLCATHSET